MKKILLVILLLSLMFLSSTKEVKADVVTLPRGRNYLDLNQMVEWNFGPDAYKTKEKFLVKENTGYTIVMSKAFLMDLYDTIESRQLNYRYWPSLYTTGVNYKVDEINQRAYIEIQPSPNEGDNYMTFTDLAIPSSHLIPNYEIILYEGTYADFPGFEPYLSETDEITLHGHMKINYDHLLSTDTISSYVNAKDPNGQNLVVNLIEDSYTTSNKLPGNYQMVFESSHNMISKNYILSIIVEDLTAPTIQIANPIEIEMSEKVDLQTVLSYIEVTDNVDQMDYQHLVIKEDTYSDSLTTGTYHITVEATDTSANMTTKTFDIQVLDTKGPTIKGPSQMFIYMSDPTMTPLDILSNYTVSDDVSVNEQATQLITNEYMATTTPGVYKVTIEARDSSDNITHKDIYIHVIDNRGPEFQVDEAFIITTTPTEVKSDDDIISWLSQNLSAKGLSASNIKIDYNEYALKSSDSGQYYVYMSYDIEDETYQTRIMMEVIGDDPFYKNPIYLLGIIPIAILTTYIIYRKKKVKI